MQDIPCLYNHVTIVKSVNFVETYNLSRYVIHTHGKIGSSLRTDVIQEEKNHNTFFRCEICSSLIQLQASSHLEKATVQLVTLKLLQLASTRSPCTNLTMNNTSMNVHVYSFSCILTHREPLA